MFHISDVWHSTFCASTMLFWLLQHHSIVWSQEVWYLQLCSIFSRLLWRFRLCCKGIAIMLYLNFHLDICIISNLWKQIYMYFSSVQSLSRVQFFATPWITAHQSSLFIANSRSLPKLMSIESVMPSSHLILSSTSPPASNPSQHQSLFQWANSSHEVAKVLEFQL